MPSRRVLIALLAVASVPPFVARALGTGLFAFGMFVRVERYHVEVRAVTHSGRRQVTLRSLDEHLSNEARRILGVADGWAVGTEQVELVAGGLGDVGRLVCAVDPDATKVELELFRGPVRFAREPLARREIVDCEERR